MRCRVYRPVGGHKGNGASETQRRLLAVRYGVGGDAAQAVNGTAYGMARQ